MKDKEMEMSGICHLLSRYRKNVFPNINININIIEIDKAGIISD